MNIQRRIFLTSTTAAAFGCLSAPHVARAAVRVVKLGHNSVATSQYGSGCLAIAEAAAAHPDLAGIKIDVRGNAELGDEGAMFADVRAGALDMMAGVTAVATTVCPEIGLLDVPFVFKDVTRGRAAFDGAFGEDYAEALRVKGVNLVGWLENGLRQLTSNRLVRKPQDMVGLKLRVPPSQIAVDSFAALGADAKPLPFNQVYEALRTGQFEAQENPVASAESIKLYEVQKYLCMTGHTYSVGIVIASTDMLEDLTPKQIAALRSCTKVGTQRSREVAQGAARDGVGRLQRAGMTIVDDIDKEAFIKAARVNLDRLVGQFGKDRVERLIAASA